MGKTFTICPLSTWHTRDCTSLSWGCLQFLLLHVANYQPRPGMDAVAGKEVCSFYVFSQVGVELGFKHSAGRTPNWKAGLKGKQLRNLCWSPIISPTWTLKRSDPRPVEHLKFKVTTLTHDTYLSRMKVAKSYCIILAVAKDYWPKRIQTKLLLGISSQIWGPKLAIKIFDVLHVLFQVAVPSKMLCIFSVFKVAEDAELRSSIHWQKPTGVALLSLLPLLCRSKVWPNPRWFGWFWMCFLEFAD